MSSQPASLQDNSEEPLPRFWPREWGGKWGKKLALSLFAFVNGTISTALLALLAHWTRSSLVFPSLGPTAFLLFHRPLAPVACPRNSLAGHFMGITAGWLCLFVLGLADAPSILDIGVSWPRIAAAGLSLGLTSGLMVLLQVPHPPAGATTLIVSLGLIHKPWQLPLLMVGVLLLILQGFAINRLAGIPYPLWGPVHAAIKARYPSLS